MSQIRRTRLGAQAVSKSFTAPQKIFWKTINNIIEYVSECTANLYTSAVEFSARRIRGKEGRSANSVKSEKFQV
jgi:hypothetical protein